MTAFFSDKEKHPLIAILRGIKPTEVVDVAEILIEKDFKIIEIPLNSPDPIRSIELLNHHFENHAIIGAGTVLDEVSIRSVSEAGAKLVVMPNGNGEVVRAAKDRGLIAIPGIATPTEAFAMIEAGADALKLFPAEGKTQPDAFGSIIRSFWWSTITLTTIGYGDVYPITILGKIATTIIAIAGIGIVAIPAGIIAGSFSEITNKKK